MKDKLSKLQSVYSKYGFVGFMKKILAYFVANYVDRISLPVLFNPRLYRRRIQEMLSGDYDRVVLWRDRFGYKVPLFQRPQHIAGNLAKKRCLVIYEVTTMTDNVRCLERHGDNLYLFNFNNILLEKLLMKELDKVSRPKYLQIYSTDWKLSLDDVKEYQSRGFQLIYEYIDHISPELAGTKDLPKNISDKYDFVMSCPDVYVVVTAELLRQDVISHRGTRRLALSTNGVDYNFFRHLDADYEFEPEFQTILDKGKPVVCYYGALASWFDYELVARIADSGKYSVVLFGAKYDNSFDRIQGYPEIYFLGTRDYHVLKYYAMKADIMIIPFLINDITRATNPVKLFEYMAMHKPIVTTDMNECRQFSSVLIGRNHDEFLSQLDHALSLKDNAEYIALLDREARENDWSAKAAAIIEMLEES